MFLDKAARDAAPWCSTAPRKTYRQKSCKAVLGILARWCPHRSDRFLHQNWLVVWNMNFMTFHSVGNNHPTDEIIFFRGVRIPSTKKSKWGLILDLWWRSWFMSLTFHGWIYGTYTELVGGFKYIYTLDYITIWNHMWDIIWQTVSRMAKYCSEGWKQPASRVIATNWWGFP